MNESIVINPRSATVCARCFRNNNCPCPINSCAENLGSITGIILAVKAPNDLGVLGTVGGVLGGVLGGVVGGELGGVLVGVLSGALGGPFADTCNTICCCCLACFTQFVI